jgi:hypothetical protein
LEYLVLDHQWGTDLGYALQAYSAYRNGQDIFTGRFPKAQSEKAKKF